MYNTDPCKDFVVYVQQWTTMQNVTGSKFLHIWRHSAILSPKPGAKQLGSIAAKHCPRFSIVSVFESSHRRTLCDGFEPGIVRLFEGWHYQNRIVNYFTTGLTTTLSSFSTQPNKTCWYNVPKNFMQMYMQRLNWRAIPKINQLANMSVS